MGIGRPYAYGLTLGGVDGIVQLVVFRCTMGVRCQAAMEHRI